MPSDVKRGYVPTDLREFSDKSIEILKYVQQDLVYLLDRGYEISAAINFLGNKFQLSSRQRSAITRASSSKKNIENRIAKRLEGNLDGKTIHIDAFNLIILLEAAQSVGTTILNCMDGTLRDLCGIHGTYRIINSTYKALEWIKEISIEKKVSKLVFYVDEPISNSGRLKGIIYDVISESVDCEVNIVRNPDRCLYDKENVVSSDAIILDNCVSWINFGKDIVYRFIPDRKFVNLC